MSDQVKSPTVYAVQNLDDKLSWNERLRPLQAWDEENDPISLSGPPAIPMPVQVSSKDTLEPFFEYLRGDASLPGMEPDIKIGVATQEPYYDTQMLEFTKGSAYVDGRMDMCKMVVGPDHIEDLMSSLRQNTSIKHFLLGNNVIGRRGAASISKFVKERPNAIETWYLGGNCMDAEAFGMLVDAFTTSDSIHSVWVKRNPLTSAAASNVLRLITGCKNLRTLDLDQSELGNVGVTAVFDGLTEYIAEKSLPLRNIYLNGVGVSTAACSAINRFLTHPNCQLESLFMSNNPIGDAGLLALSKDLNRNESLLRLVLQSDGLKDTGVIALINQVKTHKKLTVLNLGQSYATPDLGTRFNHLTDVCFPAVLELIEEAPALKVLDLRQSYMTHETVVDVLGPAVCKSSLLHFTGGSVLLPPGYWKSHRQTATQDLNAALSHNIQTFYNDPELTLQKFEDEYLRFWRNCNDVRFVDSVYRNRDAGKARRGQLVLDKWWTPKDWNVMQQRVA